MATAAMIDDRLQIDGFDPYTWSGTYGVNTDGFRKDTFMDGSYFTQIDETPMNVTETLQNADDPNLDQSGPMYLKTVAASTAPFPAFPARKMEYSDGTTTWYRPGQPWSWFGGAEQETRTILPTFKKKSQGILFWLILLALIFFLVSKFKGRF
jgi:hypothetical protein